MFLHFTFFRQQKFIAPLHCFAHCNFKNNPFLFNKQKYIMKVSHSRLCYFIFWKKSISHYALTVLSIHI